MNSSDSPRDAASGLLRSVLSLSVGTFISRAVAAASQFVLIFWISPAEFGRWAAAVSALAVITAFTNFGLVQGYLASNASSSISACRLRIESRNVNGLLLLLGLAVAGVYWGTGSPSVAVLVSIAACAIPIQGASAVEYALRLRLGHVRRIVIVQIAASIMKLAVGIAVAVITGSAIALAVSHLVYAACSHVFMRTKQLPHERNRQATPASVRKRFLWAINRVAMQVPLYGAIFVAQFLTTPEVLGIYYLANSAILALSSIVAPLLGKVALNAMADVSANQRAGLAMDIGNPISAATACGAALVAILAPMAAGGVSDTWVAALTPLVLMCAALPNRMTTPVLDAIQQSSDRWWSSTGFYVLDGIGTCIAALVAVTDSPVHLALAICIWRTFMGGLRVTTIVPGVSVQKMQLLTMPLAIFILLAIGSVNSWLLLTIIGSILALAWLVISMRQIYGRKGVPRKDTPVE